MSLIWSKNGFRGEYLARYIVSKFAFVSESSVGEDFGIDFYCGLIKDAKDPKFVHFDKPFLLQIKTTERRGAVKYDTRNKISSLYNLNLPFFIGHLNLKNGSLDIHSTSMMWHAFIKTGVENISRITFEFREKNKKGVINSPEIKPLKKVQFGNGFNHLIDLGKPIVTLKLKEIENNPDQIDNARAIISKCIDKEQANILNKQLKLYYYRWLYKHETNKPDTFEFGYNFIEDLPEHNFFNPQKSLNKLDHFLISLAISYKNAGMMDEYQDVCRITRRISPDQWLKNVQQYFPDIYKAHEDL